MEYLQNRITYNQRVQLAKKQAKQTRRSEQFNKAKEVITFVVVFVSVVLIIGLVENL